MGPSPELDRPSVELATALESEAQAVLSNVRRAFRGILERLPNPPARPRDLETSLGIHKTLAWRVSRVAYGRDALTDAQHIPGNEGVEIFLQAARATGVEDASLESVRSAVARFRSLVQTHAGDRPSLQIMLRSLNDGPESGADLRASRRAAFRCASHLWGTQTRLRVLAGIYTPTGNGLADLATIRGYVGLRRVRKEGYLELSRTVESDTDKPGPRLARVEAVEPEGLLGGAPILRDFCTTPLPPVEAVVMPDRNVEYRFVNQRIGARGEVTVYTADIRRGLQGCLRRDDANTLNALVLGIKRPMEMAIIDMWYPAGLFGPSIPSGVCACAMRSDPVRVPPSQWRRLPLAEHAEHLGRGMDACAIAGVPEYSRVVERVFSRLNWKLDEYEVHRFAVEYPVMGTSLAMVVDLPE